MHEQAIRPVENTAKARYALHTYSLPERISLKQATDSLYPGVTERYGPDCLIFHLSAAEKIFVFKFGAVVFFNVPTGAHQNYLDRLNLSTARKSQDVTAEEDIAEDEVTLSIEPGVLDVGFNSATIPEFDMVFIQIVAQVLGQASALELIEWEVEEFLRESERLTRFLQGREFKRPTRKSLLQYLGQGLSTKHRIVSQLALMSEPEKTWEREEAYKLYSGLYNNFEIRERVEKVEKMLRLSSEVSELLLEIVNTRRSEILEFIIIVLIAFELIKSLLLK
ncbi:MAG: RMD1 family protein [Deltaproteobacteria bacterium]|nr:RMD1 family protein [Deltaproteobacteria bacterium]